MRATEDDFTVSAGMRMKIAAIRIAGQVLLQRTNFPTTGGPHANAFGGHGELMYALPVMGDGLEVGYRFSILDESDLMPANMVQEHTAGVNLVLPDYHLRWLVNYPHPLQQSARSLKNARIETLVEASF